MFQFISRPDLSLTRCGTLECGVAQRPIPGAPAFMRGVRLLFVADVHVLPRTAPEAIDAFAARLGALAPDALLLGGDYADDAVQARRLFDALAKLPTPPLGSFAVLGNNDREAWPDVEVLRAALGRVGITLLVNQSRTLRLPGGSLVIAGVDEHHRGEPHAERLYPARGAPDRYRVLLSHYPRVPEVPPDLVLSGHTHGGQFNFLGLTPFSIGFERLLNRDLASDWVAGLKTIRGARLLVSKGIGASRLQWRVGVRPQIEWITFPEAPSNQR